MSHDTEFLEKFSM